MRIRLHDECREDADRIPNDDQVLDTLCRDYPRVRRVVTVILFIFTSVIVYWVGEPFYVAARWAPRLRACAQGSDRLVIRTGCPGHSDANTNRVCFETTDRDVIAATLAIFEASPDVSRTPLGWGSPTLYFCRTGHVLVAVGPCRSRFRWYGGPYGDALPGGESWQRLTGFLKPHGVNNEDFR